MIISQQLRARINYQGEFDELLIDVAKSYSIGEFVSFEIIEMGYEDVNVKLLTSEGTYFVKIFAESRDDAQCLRLINVVNTAIENGVTHPKFLRREAGYIFRERYDDFNIRLAVFEWIDGKTFYELKRNPNEKELSEIIRMASLGNSIGYKPAPLYDSWAIVNFAAEFEKVKDKLDKATVKSLNALLEEFGKVDIASLPHALVHGDLISTNIMKADDQIYFVDFSVANYYPRIVELAVLMTDVMFDKSGKKGIDVYYKMLLSEYQKHIELTKVELDILPLFIKLGHAMRIIGATREAKNKSIDQAVNKYFLESGTVGLAQAMKSL